MLKIFFYIILIICLTCPFGVSVSFLVNINRPYNLVEHVNIIIGIISLFTSIGSGLYIINKLSIQKIFKK